MAQETRRRGDDEEFDFKEQILQTFSWLYNNYQGTIFKTLNQVSEHPVYHILITTKDDETFLPKNADEVFSKYIMESYPLCNKEYFIFVIKFAVLFRESINIFRKASDSSKEFTQEQGADNVPDLCNEFITEFMEQNEYFGLNNDELIEIIQQFCFWLYDNKFTASRLTLLS
jgi:hypothetical protein